MAKAKAIDFDGYRNDQIIAINLDNPRKKIIYRTVGEVYNNTVNLRSYFIVLQNDKIVCTTDFLSIACKVYNELGG